MQQTTVTPKDNSGWLRARAGELHTSFTFATRLPLPREAALSGPAIAAAMWAMPIAGIVVGAIGGAIYALAHVVGLPAWPAAALAVAATLIVTGCLHEDGLADTADGWGGGKTREQKLAIMRDSRIGVFGACAVGIALLLRISALASLGSVTLVVLALIAAHGAARAVMPLLMFMPPARSDGLSFAAGEPPRWSAVVAGVLGVVVLGLCLGPIHGLIAAVLLLVIVVVMARMTSWQIGGQTGDVLGALEQVGEIAVLLVAARGALLG
jgi:adenosylcobinamide-GDP ribazoletransferase